MDKIHVICDKCNVEFKLSAYEIKKGTCETVKYGFCSVLFFVCPKCGKVYIVSVDNSAIREYKHIYNVALTRVKEAQGNKTEKEIKDLIDYAERKKDIAIDYEKRVIRECNRCEFVYSDNEKYKIGGVLNG